MPESKVPTTLSVPVVLHMTVDVEAWATEYGVDPTPKAVLQNIREWWTQVSEPGDISQAWKGLVEKLEIEVKPKLEIVVDRDPDGVTGVTLFRDGTELNDLTGISITVVDPGYSGADEEWRKSMRTEAKRLSKAARGLVRVLVNSYSGKY